MQSRAPALSNGSAIAPFALAACICMVFLTSCATTGAPTSIRVQSSGTPPQLAFACCDQGIAPMQALFADHEVVQALRDLHAQVGVAIADFSPERAQVVRFLNQQQIPVIAGVTLQTKDGPYFNADDVAEAPAQIAAFEKWTDDNGLRWAAVGLDIEPNFSELASLRSHPGRLLTTLLGRSLNGKRIARAQAAYSGLIRQLQSQGYSVETYSLPYVPVERSMHTRLLDRMLGTIDLPSNEDDLMVYTSYARRVGSAILLYLGPHAQGIIVGVTDGLVPAGSGFGPLDWNEFSRDLLVASHYSRHIGVYNLEGCVRQGFLPRLATMNWGESVFLPAASVARAHRHVMVFCTALWIASHLPWLAALALLLIALWIWRRRTRKQTLRSAG